MKTLLHKFIAAGIIIAILALSPMYLFGQQKLLGDLSITKNSPEGFVTVDGERVISGRSIKSPSVILTSPQASSKISIIKTGIILLSPNSKVNLSFKDSSISMDMFSGEISIETLPNTSLNLFIPDGNLTLPIESQANTIKVKIVNGRTQVETLVGKAWFNNVLITAGETYPLPSTTTSNKPADSDNNSKGFNPLLIIGLLGAAGAVALIALSGSSSNSEMPIVSPVR
jgi:hypothetical protein